MRCDYCHKRCHPYRLACWPWSVRLKTKKRKWQRCGRSHHVCGSCFDQPKLVNRKRNTLRRCHEVLTEDERALYALASL